MVGQQADGRSFFFQSPDGLRLHARIWDARETSSRFVVCLPGLSRNARDFEGLAVRLSGADAPRNVVAFDYRGRGLSAYDPDWRRYTVATEAADVLAGLDALGIGEASFIGTSRGGLIIHLLAAMRRGLIKAAVLNDIGPVLGRDGLRQIKAYLENPRRPASFAEAATIQMETHGAAFPALVPEDWQRLVRALYRDEMGVPAPDFDPALLESVRAIDPDGPLPDLWPQFSALRSVPLLVIRGEHSRLLDEATVAAMAAQHPDLATVTVAGQGHPPMLETGDLPERIARFLDVAEREAP